MQNWSWCVLACLLCGCWLACGLTAEISGWSPPFFTGLGVFEPQIAHDDLQWIIVYHNLSNSAQLFVTTSFNLQYYSPPMMISPSVRYHRIYSKSGSTLIIAANYSSNFGYFSGNGLTWSFLSFAIPKSFLPSPSFAYVQPSQILVTFLSTTPSPPILAVLFIQQDFLVLLSTNSGRTWTYTSLPSSNAFSSFSFKWGNLCTWTPNTTTTPTPVHLVLGDQAWNAENSKIWYWYSNNFLQQPTWDNPIPIASGLPLCLLEFPTHISLYYYTEKSIHLTQYTTKNTPLLGVIQIAPIRIPSVSSILHHFRFTLPTTDIYITCSNDKVSSTVLSWISKSSTDTFVMYSTDLLGNVTVHSPYLFYSSSAWVNWFQVKRRQRNNFVALFQEIPLNNSIFQSFSQPSYWNWSGPVLDGYEESPFSIKHDGITGITMTVFIILFVFNGLIWCCALIVVAMKWLLK